MLWQYVSGPKWKSKSYLKYRVNGYIFSPQRYDDSHSIQDSGVCMDAITTFVASAKDINPTDDDTTWYGIIKEIIEVDYYDFQHVVLSKQTENRLVWCSHLRCLSCALENVEQWTNQNFECLAHRKLDMLQLLE